MGEMYNKRVAMILLSALLLISCGPPWEPPTPTRRPPTPAPTTRPITPTPAPAILVVDTKPSGAMVEVGLKSINNVVTIGTGRVVVGVTPIRTVLQATDVSLFNGFGSITLYICKVGYSEAFNVIGVGAGGRLVPGMIYEASQVLTPNPAVIRCPGK